MCTLLKKCNFACTSSIVIPSPLFPNKQLKQILTAFKKSDVCHFTGTMAKKKRGFFCISSSEDQKSINYRKL